MIYDCFLFNNEIEVLEIRLHELANIVDKFVITESTVTHMNKKKELVFYKNRKRFEKFKNKIIHNIVTDSPNVNNPWIINDFQFSAMGRGLKNAKPDDIVLFGDVDEIPKSKKVFEAVKKRGKHKIFKQWLCYYFLNYASTKPYTWPGTHMMKYVDLKKLNTVWIAKYSPIDMEIEEGGWHFSYMGGIKRIQQKISAQAHQEYNNDRYNTPENILKAIRQGKDFMDAGVKFKVQPDDFLPEYVITNKSKLSKLLLRKDYGKAEKIIPSLILPILHKTRVFIRKKKYSR